MYYFPNTPTYTMEVRNRFRLFNSKGIHYNDSVKSHCQVLFSLTIKRGTMEQAEFDKLNDLTFNKIIGVFGKTFHCLNNLFLACSEKH